MSGNVVPDHATIARFVIRHERALGDLFAEVLKLCAKAGLVRPGVVAVDGSKLAANASRDQNLDYGQIAREIIAQAKAIDEAEDEEHGDARGDELGDELSTDAGRRAWLQRELGSQRTAASDPEAPDVDEPVADDGDSLMRSGSSPDRKVARAGCAKPSANSTPTGGPTRRGCAARATSGCWTPGSV